MTRLRERQELLEPNRIDIAMQTLTNLGFEPKYEQDNRCVWFIFQGKVIKYYPYTGWATGKTIKDGRGLRNLLKQLKETENDTI